MKIKEFQEKYFTGLTREQMIFRLTVLLCFTDDKLKFFNDMYNDYKSIEQGDLAETINQMNDYCIDWSTSK